MFTTTHVKFINLFIYSPNSYRCCVRSRWIVQKSNRCLFEGLPHLTFSAGKSMWLKTLVIPQMTSGWSTEVSTFLSTVPYSGTHTWVDSQATIEQAYIVRCHTASVTKALGAVWNLVIEALLNWWFYVTVMSIEWNIQFPQKHPGTADSN